MNFSNFIDKLIVKADDWSDLLLPAAINDFKQTVKSRIFNGVILIGSLCYFVIAICLFIYFDKERMGQTSFLLFNGILDLGLIVVIPIILFQNMSTERANGNFELTSITTITPLKIVLGKWQSGLMQSFVFGSIVAPIIIFSYIINGIGISVIFLNLILTVLASQLSILLSIFLCSLGVFKSNRLASQFLSSLLNILLFLLIAIIKVVTLFFDQITASIINIDFILPSLIFLVLLITMEIFLVAVSSARLSPYASNKSTIPRLVYSILVLEVVVLIFLKESITFINFESFLMQFIVANSTVTFFFLMEKDELTKNIYYLYIKEEGFLKNIFKKLFYPGKSSAYLLFIFQTVLLIASYIYTKTYIEIEFDFIIFVSRDTAIISCIYLVLFLLQKKYPLIKSNLFFLFAIVLLFFLAFLTNIKFLNLFFAGLIVLIAMIIAINAIRKKYRTKESVREFLLDERMG